MKQTILVLALGASFALPFAAHAQSGYIGANVGDADQKASADGFGSDSHTRTGYKLYGGVDFTKNVGLEAGYVDFGNSTYSEGGASLHLKPKAAYVAVTGTLPLSEKFSLFGKLGASFNHVKLDASAGGFSDSTSKNRTTALVGVGAAYNFNKNLAAVAEYEDYGKVADEDGDNLKINMLSVGLRYHF